MAYYTRPDFSRQIKQYSGTTAILSGQTNILEKFSVKNIEIDTAGALDGNALLYDLANNKFVPAVIGAFGSGIVQGLILTYDSGLTYNISSGSFRIGATLYQGYAGGSVTISSGQTGGSRFDVVYITSAETAYVKSGITATNPSIPALSGGELQIGIIFVPVNFTGGTGTTVIQTTADTVFEYYNAGTGIQRSPNTTNAEAPGAFSFALANNSKAYGEHSSALGHYSKASGYSQTVVGPYNDPNTDDYFQVGNGTSDGSRSNAFRVTTGGSTYIQNKLFVSNGIEIEVTGASNGQALVYDNSLNKFRPQNVSGGTGGSGSTSGTSLGGGVKVLFSSDTTSLSFATLSSQTPSTLRIVSSSTGVILFSAVTGSGGGPNYEYMDYSTASGGGPFVTGQWYRIPVSSRTVTEANNPNNYGDILLFAVETNKLSPDGYLFAINADYNYTNSYANLGVPYDGITVNNSDVIIWNNRHWENLSFSVPINSQNDITTQLSPLTKDYVSSNGYTIEVDKITYDITNDRILSRQDKRGNIIHENSTNLILDRFRFGDDNVTNNFIKASNVQNFDVLNIPKNNLVFKDNTFTCFNKLFFDTSTLLLPTGTSCPVYISGVSVNDGKFEALTRITAYNGSINNFKSTIEETLTLTSTSIDLRYKYLTGKITLLSGSGFNNVVSSITQFAGVLYNVDVTFNAQDVSGITFQSSDLVKTEGGLNAFISGTTFDSIEFGQPYGISIFLQKNINNYI